MPVEICQSWFQNQFLSSAGIVAAPDRETWRFGRFLPCFRGNFSVLATPQLTLCAEFGTPFSVNPCAGSVQ